MNENQSKDEKKDDKKPKKYFYFVNNEKYESELPALTGAQIKARIPNLEPNTGLSLEGHGNDPDEMIADDQLVSLEKDHGPLRFTLVPPATFG
jgi:hypothetical protein